MSGIAFRKESNITLRKSGGIRLLNRLFAKYHSVKKKRLGGQLSISISINSFESGLAFPYYGKIVVNGKAKVGDNFRILTCVTIGVSGDVDNVPVIGDNCFIGTGAKIIGKIRICNDVKIGANVVVLKDMSDGAIVARVPAKIIGWNKR